MRNKKSWLFIVILLISLIVPIVFAEITSSNYQIETPTISSGGVTSNSSDYKIKSISGIIAGNASSSSYKQHLGFWFAMLDSTPPWINFTDPTPANGTTQLIDSIYVNLTTSDESLHYSFVDFDNSLVLWMRMDDINSSGDPTDISSYSNNGSAEGNAAQTSAGYYGKAFTFDGDSDYVDVNPGNGLILNQSATISAWIYIKGLASGYGNTIFMKGDGVAWANLHYILFEYDGSDKMHLSVSDGSSALGGSGPQTATLSENQWHHIVATWNSSHKCIYTNGSLSECVQSSIMPKSTMSGCVAKIGVTYATSYDFNGTIDEVLIFNRSLSANEILSLYNQTSYYHNFTSLSKRAHTFTGYAVDKAGNKNQTETRTVIQNNTAPEVGPISGPGGYTIDNQDVTEDSTNDLEVSYTVYDTDGVFDIDTSKANLTLSDGTDTSYNTSCVSLGEVATDTLNFTCSIEIHYWYGAASWTLTAGIEDGSGAPDDNSTTFTLDETTAIVISPDEITFPTLEIGQTDIQSNNDPIIVNNTANDDIGADDVSVEGYDLIGEIDIGYAIGTGNFSVNITDECGGTVLVNNTATQISGSVLAAGNRSAGEGNESLYLCIETVPGLLLPQTYSTLNSTAWTISVS